MKRAPVIEDWSRFNRAVLDAADGLPRPATRKPAVPLPPRRGPAEPAPDPADRNDPYGLIARNTWRTRA